MIVAEKEPFTLLPRGALGKLCFGGDQVVSFREGLSTWMKTKYLDRVGLSLVQSL